MSWLNKLSKSVNKNKKIKDSSVVLFLRQLSVLLENGVSIEKSLEILKESSVNKETKMMVSNLYEKTVKGALLSKTSKEFGYFDPLLIASIEAGEESGTLNEMISEYNVFLEKKLNTKKRIEQAFIYPIILTIISFITVFYLILFVIPSFVSLFDDSGVLLPAPTRILINMSRFFERFGVSLLVFVILVVTGLIFYGSTKKGKMILAKLKRKTPIISTLERDLHSQYIASLMALFFSSNINMIGFLNILIKGLENPLEKLNLTIIKKDIERGSTISGAFSSVNYYSSVFIGMLKIGEETGRLSEVSRQIASYLELEIDIKIKRYISIMEPLIILLLALMIGFIVLAIALPMFQMVHLYDV